LHKLHKGVVRAEIRQNRCACPSATYSAHQLANFAHKSALRGATDSMDRMAVGPKRTLLVCCGAFRLSAGAIGGTFPNSRSSDGEGTT
jgi:hypothetical protein